MADIAQVIRTLVLTDSTVSSTVALRFYPDVLPEEPTLPACTIRVIDTIPSATLDTSGEVLQARIQISCFAETRIAANSLCEAIRTAISKYRGTASSVQIQEIDLETGEVHGTIRPASGSGRWRYITSQDFRIFYVTTTVSVP